MPRRLMTLSITLTLLACSAGTANAAAGWTIESTPNPAGVQQAYFNAISCASATSCMAVGETYDPPAGPPALAEYWNGSTWAIQKIAEFRGSYPALLDVSCGAPTSCMATTAKNAPTEYWNGSTWAVEKFVKPTASGSRLDITPVSCASATSCMAVGSYSVSGACRDVAESWNGSAWSVQATFPGGCDSLGGAGLQAISCPTVSSCLAVGFGNADYWNGTTWTAETLASPGGTATAFLSGVSCTGPASCTAAGFYNTADGRATLAEYWNGSTWTIQPTSNKGKSTQDELEAVSCSTATSCAATGQYTGTGKVTKSLAEYWNGSTWAIQATPNPAGTTLAALYGVSCPAPATPCTAAGDYSTATKSYRTLAEVSPG
jgi:hypothetical protein